MITKTEQEIDRLLTELATLCQGVRDAEKVAGLVRRQHRTHQQSIGRFMQATVNVFAKMYDDKHYDLRNEATCNMCYNIRDSVDECSIPFI